MYHIGLLFDIDKLKSSYYGKEAFKILFKSRILKLLKGFSIWGGDVNIQLPGAKQPYCFCIYIVDHHSSYYFQDLYHLLSVIHHPALPPIKSRFINSDDIRMQLVHLANISSSCEVLPEPNGLWVAEVAKDVKTTEDLNLQFLNEIKKGSNPSTVQTFIDKGADVNATDNEYGKTALMVATKMGKDDVVQILLDKGADVNGSDDFANTALLVAAEKGSNNIIHILLNKGADINIKGGSQHRTTLIMAAMFGQTTTVKILLENGADINATDDFKTNALVCRGSC